MRFSKTAGYLRWRENLIPTVSALPSCTAHELLADAQTKRNLRIREDGLAERIDTDVFRTLIHEWENVKDFETKSPKTSNTESISTPIFVQENASN